MTDAEKLTPEEQRTRNARMEEIMQMIVAILPEREPLDHVALACASVIAASVAALPDEHRKGAMQKIVRFMERRIAWSDDTGFTKQARAALRRSKH
jgi:hypothetical protein